MCDDSDVLRGLVLNVIYVPLKTIPCYVSVSGDRSQSIQYNHYLGASDIELCKFAERAMHSRSSVKLYPMDGHGSTRHIAAISFDEDEAKFWKKPF